MPSKKSAGRKAPVKSKISRAAGPKKPSEKKRPEAPRSRQHYVELYEYAPVGYLTLDTAGVIQEVNLTGCRMLGVEHEQLMGSPLLSIVSREDAEGLRDCIARVLESSESQTIEVTLRSSDGTAREVRLDSIRSEAGEDGSPQIRTAFHDIRKQKQAERDNRLQAKAIQNLTEGVLITGKRVEWPGPEILFANEAMARITGYTVEEMLGQTPRLFQGAKTDRRVLDHIRGRLKARLPVRCELVNHRKDGTPYEAELFIAPITNDAGELTHFVSVHSDISSRKRLYQELKDRQAKLKAVLDTAVECIVTIDEAGLIEEFNPAGERTFGYSAKEVIGRNVALLMPAPYHDEHDGYLDRYLRTGERRIIGIGREVEGRRSDGSVFPIDLSVSEFFMDGHRMFTGIIRDITERKAYKEQTRRWNEELKDRIEESTRELIRTNRELRELNTFISHDLRTPLRAVKNYVDFLAEDLEGQIQGRAAEDLKHLEVAAQELQEMVQDVLVYSQLGRERNLTPGEIDCRHLIESITSSLSMGSNRRVIVEGELPVLHAPAVLVRPIFQNLIENGLKYNRSETPEVRVTAVRLEGQPTVWEFDFHDNGIGIDTRHHEDIFRLFRRLHSGGDFAGTGIGLASVNKAVDLLGGSIRVESSLECGSSFFIQLPERQG